MEKLLLFFNQFKWIIHGLGLLFLLFILGKMGISISEIMKIFFDEIKQLIGMKYNSSSLNMLGIIAIFIFGIIIIIADGSGSLVNFVNIFVDSKKSSDFSKSVDLIYLLYVLASFATVSVIVVAFRKR